MTPLAFEYWGKQIESTTRFHREPAMKEPDLIPKLSETNLNAHPRKTANIAYCKRGDANKSVGPVNQFQMDFDLGLNRSTHRMAMKRSIDMLRGHRISPNERSRAKELKGGQT